MEFNEIKKILGNGIKKYRILKDDGTKEEKRLFISSNDELAYCGKNMRNRGYRITKEVYSHWISLTLMVSKADITKRMVKRANDALLILSESGLWNDIRKEIEEFAKLPYDTIKADFVNGDIYELYRANKYHWLKTYQIFSSFKAKTCWKSPNYGHFLKNTVPNNLGYAIKNGEFYHYSWRNGYDNTVETKTTEDGKKCAWYSEEYKDCGNGHYYLLFDARHAIFYEDD